MIRNLKALAALAALAVTAITASAAHAELTKFTAGATSGTITGTQTGATELVTNNGNLLCTGTHIVGTFTVASTPPTWRP